MPPFFFNLSSQSTELLQFAAIYIRRVFDVGNEGGPNSDTPRRETFLGSTHRVDLVCPHSRITPAVFVPACVAPMAFPICQGRPPSPEERWEIRQPDKIK